MNAIRLHRSAGPRWRTVVRHRAQALFAPESGLVVTWFALIFITAAIFGPLAASTVTMGSFTLLLLMMLAVAAYMPPSKPFREMSELAARTADLVKVASGAALFGAAAAYGGIVSTLISRLPISEQMSPKVVWGVIWPILLIATAVGSSVVGVRLGWSFRRSGHRDRLVALGKLRAWLPTVQMKRHPVTGWLAHVVIVASRSGAFMLLGYFTPIIVAGDIWLVRKFVQLDA